MKKSVVALIFVLSAIVLPTYTFAAWTDNLIFHAPLNDPNNPLTVSTGNGAFTYTRASTATYIHPTTGLVTTSPANIVMYSEDLSGSTWTNTSASVLTDQSVAPDGTMTADELIVGASGDGNTTHYTKATATSTGTQLINQIFTASVYVKANTNTWISVSMTGRTGTLNQCYFNTTTGQIGTCAANAVGTSTPANNGFYRYSVSGPSGTTASVPLSLRVYLAEADNDQTWTGNGTNSVYVWGGMINSGPVLADYIKTTTDFAANPRIESGGYLSEGTRSNHLLWSRDLTNVAWTKTNMSTSKTGTGYDGQANSATILTASASDATVCQGVTIASATSSASVDIKRISGSGPVAISMDGGVTYGSDISPNLSQSSWYRAYTENQKIVNPSLCIKLSTNGDSILVDYTQVETGGSVSSPTTAPFISSRIPTTSYPHTRYIDKLSITSTSNWSATEGSFFAIGDVWDTANANKFFLDGGSTPTSVLLHIRSALGNGSNGILGRTTIYDGNECSYTSVNVEPKTSTKMASMWSATAGTKKTTASGAVPAGVKDVGGACAFDGNMETGGRMVLGDAYLQDGSRTIWGHMKQIMIWSSPLSDSLMTKATSGSTNIIGSVPTLTNSAMADTAKTSITLNASLDDDGGSNSTSRGFQYGPTTSYGGTSSTNGDYGTGSFSANLSGLTCGTTYHYRAFATNYSGTGYSSDSTFATSACSTAPSVLDLEISNINTGSASASSTVLSTGGEVISVRGFAYGLSPNYTATSSDTSSNTTGPFSFDFSSLTCASGYVVKSYAENSVGLTYSNQVSFTTSACPVVSDESSNANSNSNARINGPIFTGSASSLPGYIKPRPQIIYPDGRVVYLDENKETVNDKPEIVKEEKKETVQKYYIFTKNLELKDKGPEVKKLQQFLNSQEFYVSKSGDGSLGKETEYFGNMTKNALVRFQEYYFDDILKPAKLKKGTGILGPRTIKKINSLSE